MIRFNSIWKTKIWRKTTQTYVFLLWKFTIKAIFHSFFIFYHQIFSAKTFLDLRMRRICQAIRRERWRWIKCKLSRYDFTFKFLTISFGRKCHLIEIKWCYRAIFIFKKYVIRNLYGKLICQENLSRDLNKSVWEMTNTQFLINAKYMHENISCSIYHGWKHILFYYHEYIKFCEISGSFQQSVCSRRQFCPLFFHFIPLVPHW